MTPSGASARLERIRPLLVLGCALALQLLIRLVHGSPFPRALVGDEVTYHARALEVAAGRLGDPTFLWPPLQEIFLGGVYALFGPGSPAVWAVQALLLVAAGLLLRRLLLAARLPAAAADAGMALLLLDPQVAAFAQYLWPEVLHLALALGAATLLLASRPSGRNAAAAGALAGAALLAKSVFLPLVPLLAAAAAWRAEPGTTAWRRLLRSACLLLAAGAVLLPFSARNRFLHGSWRIADSSALNAWVGLNDPASRTDWDSVVAVESSAYMASGPTPQLRSRATWAKVRAKLASDGLLPTLGSQARKQYARLLDRSSFFSDQLPGGRWGAGRDPTPLSDALGVFAAAAWATTLALGVAGLVVFPWRERLPAAALPAACLLYAAGVFLVFHVKTRYRIAFLPALLFFAAALVEKGPRLLDPGQRLRTSAAGLLAGAAVGLAFDLP